MRGMAQTPSLISAVSTYVTTTGKRLSGHQALVRWAKAQPELRRFVLIADLASKCRDASPNEQDRLLMALVSVADGDHLAQLTAVACLSRRLGAVVAGWRRAGASDGDLQALEADLVSEAWSAVANAAACLAAGQPLPPRLGLVLVDNARHAVRASRRRELRSAGREVHLDNLDGFGCAPERPASEQLATEIAAAVRAGRISAKAAAPVFLTRVAGFSPEEAAKRLGMRPAVLRATRSRAERRLVA
jgi:DNA-directed RNA polymerase specialized sigma24 family protein